MEIETENKEVREKNINLVDVRFTPCGKIYAFDSNGLELKQGDRVVVESMFGLTIGRVVSERYEETLTPKEFKKVLRITSEDDLKAVDENRILEDDAKKYCFERIAARALPMKLVSTKVALDKKRIIFYFTADSRVDFRELVKDLASKFRTRIEMWQIGVRDEAKLTGGIGLCGRKLCCTTFITHLTPISIRMAKEQEIVLNASKISGLCGRLMCCLSFEYEGLEDKEVNEDITDSLIDDQFYEEYPKTESAVQKLKEKTEMTLESSSPAPEKTTQLPEREKCLQKEDESQRASTSDYGQPAEKKSLIKKKFFKKAKKAKGVQKGLKTEGALIQGQPLPQEDKDIKKKKQSSRYKRQKRKQRRRTHK